MNTSENINELVAALAKAQGQMKPAIKDKTNPHYKSRYADLASVMDACRGPLSENGIAIIQAVHTKEKDPFLVTTLAHTSGQWVRDEMPIITQKWDAQSFASALTYAKRQAMCSMVGVATDDDDAESAQKRTSVSYESVKPETITSMQALELRDQLKKCSYDYQEQVREFCRKSKISETLDGLPTSNYERLKTAMAKNIAESKAALHANVASGL